MIIAAHIPVGPRWNVPDAPIRFRSASQGVPNDTVVPLFFSPRHHLSRRAIRSKLCAGPPLYRRNRCDLLATLHNYPNLLLWMAGHRHINTVTPQPSPDPANHPEYGFWEVETSSLRDFPQQFRTFRLFATTTIRFQSSSPTWTLRSRITWRPRPTPPPQNLVGMGSERTGFPTACQRSPPASPIRPPMFTMRNSSSSWPRRIP